MFNHRTEPADGEPKLQIDGKDIQYKSNTKLLGVTSDNELSWKRHIDQLVARCNKDLNLMNYECQAYASKIQFKRLDRIQLAALRIITWAYKQTAIIDLEVECHMLDIPLKLRRERNDPQILGKIDTS